MTGGPTIVIAAGRPDAAEVTALLVALAALVRSRPAVPSGYEAWRARRLEAVRAARDR